MTRYRSPEELRRDDETLEPLLADKGFILQKRDGYRFSVDALLLAHLVTRLQGPSVSQRPVRCADLGTGCGIVPILLAKWNPFLTGCGVEIQEPLASLADRNLLLHGLEERFRIVCMDLKDVRTRFAAASFDWVTVNPPYRELQSGRINPKPEKALARHELAATLEDVCASASYLLRGKGKAFLIYPARRLAGLLRALGRSGLEPKYVRPVYPKPGEGACWVLVQAVRGGGEELRLDSPLYVENEAGAYSREMEVVFRWEFA